MTNPAVTNTSAPTPLANGVSSSTSFSDDLDDLIPEELRKIVDNAEPAPVQKTKPQEQKPAEVVQQQQQQQIPIAPQQIEEPEDIDLSADNIDKLLEGKLDEVTSKKKEVEDIKPHWYEDTTYKALISKGSYLGIPQQNIDKMIQEAADKKALEQGKYVSGIESEIEQVKNSNSLLSSEITRLKVVERDAAFDNLSETLEKFGKPMNEAATGMKKILDMEGAKVPINSLLLAKDRAEFTELIKDIDLNDNDLSQLTGYWRNYKDIHFKYTQEKASAREDLRKHLQSNIPDDLANGILKTSLMDILKDEKKYGYVKVGIQEGLDKHPEVAEVIGIAKTNFFNLVKAISNPLDYSKNSQWLDALAKFTFDAAHNANMEGKFYKMQENLSAQEALLKKVVTAYKKLADSAKGINGSRGVSKSSPSGGPAGSDEDILSEFKALLNDKIKIDKIMPMGD